MPKMMVILSAEKKERTVRENQISMQQLDFILKNHGYKEAVPVLGRYHATNEESRAVFVDTESEVCDLLAIAGMFQQSEILVERHGAGYLKDCTGRCKTELCIGARREYTSAPLAGDWTLLNGVFIQYK
jgi:hypothetical protein